MKFPRLIILIYIGLGLLITLTFYFCFFSQNLPIKNRIFYKNSQIFEKNQNEFSDKVDITRSSNIKRPVTDKKQNKPDVVVDQELIYSENKSVLLSKYGNKPIEIKLFLFDGDQIKPLRNIEVGISFCFMDGAKSNTFKSYKTDEHGQISVFTGFIGFVMLKIYTNDFIVHSETFWSTHGLNEQKILLHRGGILKVYAKNSENKTIENLKVHSHNDILDNLPTKHSYLAYNKAGDFYTLSNFPLHSTQFFFTAPNYKKSANFKIICEPNTTEILEIRLKNARVILLEIEGGQDINFININFENRFGNHSSLNERLKESRKIKRNKQLQFEIPLEGINENSFTVLVEGFKPEIVITSPNSNNYRITLNKIQHLEKLEINLFNEDGKVVPDAQISLYIANTLCFYGLTDSDGKLQINNIDDLNEYNLVVRHHGYEKFENKITVDRDFQKLKNIKLKNKNGIIGQIKFNNENVQGATVILYENEKQISWCISSDEGNYYFNSENLNEDSNYQIKAFHIDFGVAITPSHKKSDLKIYDLNLISEKSVSIKVFDQNGKPKSNRKIRITKIGSTYENEIASTHKEELLVNENYTICTNVNGEGTFYNLIHGNYFFKIIDDNETFEPAMVKLPSNQLVYLKTKYSGNKKIKIHLPDGSIYLGQFELSLQYFNDNKELIRSVCDKLFIDDSYYINTNLYKFKNFSFLLQVPGFALCKIGLFEDVKNLPDDLTFNLSKGKFIIVNVVDKTSSVAISNAQVSIFKEGIELQSLSTNEFGKISFKCVAQNIKIVVNAEGFATFSENVDLKNTNEIFAQMVLGGNLKIHKILEESVADVYIKINGLLRKLDSEGNCEFVNLPPGEYTLEVISLLKLKSVVKPQNKFLIQVNIENEKTTEFDLDKYKTLD